VAMHSFGFNAQELPPNPTNGNDFAVYERYYKEIVQGIGIKILKKYVARFIHSFYFIYIVFIQPNLFIFVAFIFQKFPLKETMASKISHWIGEN
jgi:hypothetical protein